MANSKRLNKNELRDDVNAHAALQAIGDYAPANSAYRTGDVAAARGAMEAAQTLEVQKKAEADAARDDAAAAEIAFHNLILGVKDQVKAQYGADSNEYQSLGMKKKSEYRRGGGRRPSSDGTP